MDLKMMSVLVRWYNTDRAHKLSHFKDFTSQIFQLNTYINIPQRNNNASLRTLLKLSPFEALRRKPQLHF